MENVNFYRLSTGALLMESGEEALLFGGGAPVERLESELQNYREKLVGIILPNEHSHRMRGVYDLAVCWQLPLLGHWTIILDQMLKNQQFPPCLLTDFSHTQWQCGKFGVSSFPVWYDSLYPRGWFVTVNDRAIAIVQDGRLTSQSLDALKRAEALLLDNCRKKIPAQSLAEKRRNSVYPSREAQDAQLKAAGIDLPRVVVEELPQAKSFAFV